MLESSCVARGTATFSVRLDIRSGHPAENSTELRINGDSTPHGQNWLRRKTSLSRLGISRNGDANAKTPRNLRPEVLQRPKGRTDPAVGSVRFTRHGFLALARGAVPRIAGALGRIPSGFPYDCSRLARAAHSQLSHVP